MAVPIPGTTPRITDTGQTGAQRADGFVTVQTAGARDLAQELLRAATQFGKDATGPLTAAAKKAMEPVMKAYSGNITDVTGNLKRSIRIAAGKKKYPGIGIAVGGPVHAKSSDEWDVEKKGAGNHAFLTEFGTGARRPGTQGRRTYLNVHERINNSFRRLPNGGQTFDNEAFQRMGRGFYFIMGSRDEPTRQARKGRGYPHDFGPFAVASGESYGPMPARGWMEKAIKQSSPAALQSLLAALREQIDSLQRAA